MALAAIAALVHLSDRRGAYEQAVGLDPDGGVVFRLMWGLGYTLTVAAAVAVGGVFLARKIRLPSRAAQMTAWIGAAVVLLAVGCGMTGDPEAVLGDLAVPSEAQRLEADLVPGWYGSVSAVLGMALLGCMLAQAVLLFRPAAGSFYHLGDWEEVPAARH